MLVKMIAECVGVGVLGGGHWDGWGTDRMGPGESDTQEGARVKYEVWRVFMQLK